MLKFALIGCGRIAKRHSDLLSQGHIEGANLACVCDVAVEKAQKLGQVLNVPWYSDMHDMLRKENVDVITVLSESGNHAAHVIALAPYGKPILVEKPMALTLDDADAMIKACEAHGARLFVIKQNRFNVPVVKLREAVEAGRFGKMIMGTVRVRWCRDQSYYDQDPWRGTWAMDGGVLTNQASHHIDLLEWMMGDVESVFAKSRTALVDIEAEDTAVVLLKFKSGALGLIEATTATRPKDLEGSLSVMGEHGTVEIGGFAVNKMRVWNFADNRDDVDGFLDKFSENPPNVYGFGHKAYYHHVVDCIQNNVKQNVDGHEGRKSVELIHAIYESVETGKEVFLPVTAKHSKLGRKS
jgi:UDP-N-acetyl-2-amino-2-deoxyglucuronate dehydrogenase